MESYLRRELGAGEITNKYGICNQSFQAWVKKYRTFKAQGLLGISRMPTYTTEVKKLAVEEYLEGKGSQADICRKYKIHSRHALQEWIKAYNSHRELLRGRGRGSGIYMTKGRNTTYEERVEIVSYCIEHGNDYTAAMDKYGVSYQQIYS